MALQKVLFMGAATGLGPRTFTRSSVAKAVDVDGVMGDVAANGLLIDYIDLDDGIAIDTSSILLEAARTNLVDSDDLTAWTTSGSPIVTANVSDPELGTSAHTVEDDDGAATEFIERITAFTGNADKGVVFVVRENTMPASGNQQLSLIGAATRLALDISAWVDGKPTVTASTGTFIGQRYVGRGYWALYGLAASVVAGDTNTVRIVPAITAAQTGSIDVFRVNAYDATTSTVSIMDASDAKTTDTLFLLFTAVPQEKTVYMKFVERGSVDITDARVFHIGAAGNTAPRLTIRESGGFYQAFHGNSVVSVTSTLAAAPIWGDLVELRLTLSAAGEVQLHQSINGAAETSGTLSAGASLAEAWSDTRLYLNSSGTTNFGLVSLLDVKIVAGVQALAFMQSLDPFFVVGDVAIPVEMNSAKGKVTEVGDRARTFDGTMRETIRSRVATWDAKTTPMTLTDTNIVQRALEASTQPQTASGDMIVNSTAGLPDVFTRVKDRGPVQSGNDRRYVLSFTVEDSS